MPKLLILDLDETLIHSTRQPLPDQEQVGTVLDGRYHLYIRPGVHELVQRTREIYSLAVWTAAVPEYAAEVVTQVLPGVDLAFVWARPQCTPGFRGWHKDLDHVTEAFQYDPRDILMIEDTPENLRHHRRNCVQVRPWYGDPADQELTRVLPEILAAHPLEDVRSRVRG